LNRRGFSPHVLCKKCLTSHSCPNCSINLVYHKNRNTLLCHYCGYKTLLDRPCSNEGKCDFVFSGPGVERISDEVKKIFPDNKTIIFSSDTMNRKSSIQTLEKISNNEIQILIGTQLISKGFHFPHLNCIVVIDIDLSSHGHDLRGAEKNLQLYHQLSGRAGRTGKPATVYFQTYNLNTKMITDITNKDPNIFLDKELEIRRENNLPPFQRFIALIITSTDPQILEKESFRFKNFIENDVEGKVLGPVEAPIFRLKNKFRIRLLVRGKKSQKLQNSLANIISKFKFASGLKLTIDVDPISFN
jgi:primosomal protein N' (replication factor Y)